MKLDLTGFKSVIVELENGLTIDLSLKDDVLSIKEIDFVSKETLDENEDIKKFFNILTKYDRGDKIGETYEIKECRDAYLKWLQDNILYRGKNNAELFELLKKRVPLEDNLETPSLAVENDIEKFKESDEVKRFQKKSIEQYNKILDKWIGKIDEPNKQLEKNENKANDCLNIDKYSWVTSCSDEDIKKLMDKLDERSRKQNYDNYANRKEAIDKLVDKKENEQE